MADYSVGMRMSGTSTAKMPALQSAALVRYRAARAEALEQFGQNHRIQSLWRSLTRATDTLLAEVVADAGVTLMAVGGYGRGELFPFSDVDVLVVVPEGADDNCDAMVAKVLQQLWDMHIPVSHATRTLDETIAVARRDATISAALMDVRFIAGERTVYLALKKRLRAEVFGQNPREFVADKLSERDRRHAKWGDSRFMLEPNIKEGKGGLRDLHTLTWLARYCYRINKASELVRADLLTDEEWRHYREAYLFFSTVRAAMHVLRGRADERLTFDLQTAIAADLGFRGKTAQEKAEKFMRRYFQYAREVGALTRIFCAVLEEENLRTLAAPFTQELRASALPPEFMLEGERLQFAAGVVLHEMPTLAVELFYVAQQTGLDIHPRAHLAIARALPTIARYLVFEGQANQRFMMLLLESKAPETILRRMNESGVLGALIPEFGRITGMMQYDGYHTYTVDEHTLVAVGHLAAIEAGSYEREMPLATEVAKEIAERAPLYLAMLCHDLAKGSGGGHAEKGEAIVARIAARMGHNAAQAELAGWLVRNHLLISEVAFKRDLDDPKTIEDFVQVVQSPERLRLLLLLTVADIKAVSATIWNRWKGGLIRDLYHRAMARMGVSPSEVSLPATVLEKLLQEVPAANKHVAQQFLEEPLPSSWWLRPRDEQVACIEAYARWQWKSETPALVITHDSYRAVTEVACCMAYAPQMFHLLAGAMAWIGASIVSARTMVLSSGIMIANFGIQDVGGNSFAEDIRRLEPLTGAIERAISGTLDFSKELAQRRIISRGREVTVEPSVFIDNGVSADATVIEVNARDRLGLLHDILGALAASGLQVMTAHIATYGKKAVDVFYVKDAYGIKVIHHAKLEQIQQALLAACADGITA